MSTAVETRPSVRPVPAPPGPARGRSWQTAAVSVVTVGVLAGGLWGMMAPRGAHDDGHAHISTAVATVHLPDGTLRVDGLVVKQFGHVMPGMSMQDEVPAGMRRFAVDVSLGATEDEPLRYNRRDFTVSGPGVKPVVPVDGQIDSGALTPGTEISGSLSFDVPKDARALTLRFRDGEAIALPALQSVAGEHKEHAGAEASTPALPAVPAPAADHHDAPGVPPHEH